MTKTIGSAIWVGTRTHCRFNPMLGMLLTALPMLAGVLLTLQSAVNASLARQLGGTPVRASKRTTQRSTTTYGLTRRRQSARGRFGFFAKTRALLELLNHLLVKSTTCSLPRAEVSV